MLGPRSSIITSSEPQILPLEPPVQVLVRRELHMDHLPDDAHTDSAEHGADLLGALHAAVAAIRDYEGGFALPLVEEVVDGVLELGGDTPVALRREEDEAIVRGHVPGPHARVLVLVTVRRVDPVRDAGLVKDRQAVVFQVDKVDGGS